jgi:hypothetical protein
MKGSIPDVASRWRAHPRQAIAGGDERSKLPISTTIEKGSLPLIQPAQLRYILQTNYIC